MITYEDLEKLINSITQPIKEKLISHNLKEIVTEWQKQFNLIKDDSWPPCDTFEDFKNLPDKIQNECINIHQFSPDIWKQHIIDDVESNSKFHLPTQNQKKIISDNADIIIGKDIVDFACNWGSYSLAAWEIGASSVVGFDIREENLEIAEAFKKFLKVPASKIKFVKSDIHDYEKITDLCTNKHTALIPGVMYHVHDHYQILLAVAKAKIANIIIETCESKEIMDTEEPLICWRTEKTFELISGWSDGYSTIPVGYPNFSWFKLITKQLGYELTSNTTRETYISKHAPAKFTQVRSVYVFKRIV